MNTKYKTTVADEESMMNAAKNFAVSSVHQYNIQFIEVLEESIRLFKSTKEILERMANLDEPFT